MGASCFDQDKPAVFGEAISCFPMLTSEPVRWSGYEGWAQALAVPQRKLQKRDQLSICILRIRVADFLARVSVLRATDSFFKGDNSSTYMQRL
jgi:hypothetical protein